jgi:hypothetical protein
VAPFKGEPQAAAAFLPYFIRSLSIFDKPPRVARGGFVCVLLLSCHFAVDFRTRLILFCSTELRVRRHLLLKSVETAVLLKKTCS